MALLLNWTGAGAERYRLFFVTSVDKLQGFQVYVTASDTEPLERARHVLAHQPYAAAIEGLEARRVGWTDRIDRYH